MPGWELCDGKKWVKPDKCNSGEFHLRRDYGEILVSSAGCMGKSMCAAQ